MIATAAGTAVVAGLIDPRSAFETVRFAVRATLVAFAENILRSVVASHHSSGSAVQVKEGAVLTVYFLLFSLYPSLEIDVPHNKTHCQPEFAARRTCYLVQQKVAVAVQDLNAIVTLEGGLQGNQLLYFEALQRRPNDNLCDKSMKLPYDRAARNCLYCLVFLL